MHRYDTALAAAFSLDHPRELLRWLHLTTLLSRKHPHGVRRDVLRPPGQEPLPPRARVLHSFAEDDTVQVLAELDGALVHHTRDSFSVSIVVSARRADVVMAVADELEARVPPVTVTLDGPVPVTFTDLDSGLRSVRLDLRPWDQARPLYAPQVQRAVDELVAHRPDVATARRLMLWHGAPGTGKTSAVRALMHAWRAWAQPVVVTDPEALLSDGRYLRRLLLDVDDEVGDEGEDRWQLLVLEDAEALLRKDTGGPAMSRLLNLTDGLLGQGLRCLFLITTNEPLAAVHPAVVRPGRCLAQVEFGPLPAAQAAALLGRPVHGPMTLAEVLGSRPVESLEAAPAAVGQYL